MWGGGGRGGRVDVGHAVKFGGRDVDGVETHPEAAATLDAKPLEVAGLTGDGDDVAGLEGARLVAVLAGAGAKAGDDDNRGGGRRRGRGGGSGNGHDPNGAGHDDLARVRHRAHDEVVAAGGREAGGENGGIPRPVAGRRGGELLVGDDAAHEEVDALDAFSRYDGGDDIEWFVDGGAGAGDRRLDVGDGGDGDRGRGRLDVVAVVVEHAEEQEDEDAADDEGHEREEVDGGRAPGRAVGGVVVAGARPIARVGARVGNATAEAPGFPGIDAAGRLRGEDADVALVGVLGWGRGRGRRRRRRGRWGSAPDYGFVVGEARTILLTHTRCAFATTTSVSHPVRRRQS